MRIFDLSGKDNSEYEQANSSKGIHKQPYAVRNSDRNRSYKEKLWNKPVPIPEFKEGFRTAFCREQQGHKRRPQRRWTCGVFWDKGDGRNGRSRSFVGKMEAPCFEGVRIPRRRGNIHRHERHKAWRGDGQPPLHIRWPVGLGENNHKRGQKHRLFKGDRHKNSWRGLRHVGNSEQGIPEREMQAHKKRLLYNHAGAWGHVPCSHAEGAWKRVS